MPKKTNVLVVVPDDADYLAITILHGLRALLGSKVVDYPRCDLAYRDYSSSSRDSIYGRGFSVFCLLDEEPIQRHGIAARLAAGEFQLVVFASIQRTFGLFLQWRALLTGRNTVILDGEDTPHPYPYRGWFWRHPTRWFLPRAHRAFLYFKREWTTDTHFNLCHRILPGSLRGLLPQPGTLRPISFSIPEEKILAAVPPKSKLWPRHVVDAEAAAHLPESQTSYVFSSEDEYRADLQASKFGITTKRAGWDCLRHYEIAANGCVPCFRDLHLKPSTCAPHGLRPDDNCITYRSAEELMHKVNSLGEAAYQQLAKNALAWAAANSTRERARQLLSAWGAHHGAD